MDEQILLDCSRIATERSGLGKFSRSLMAALHEMNMPFQLLASSSAFSVTPSHLVPKMLQAKTGVKILNPILWIAYSVFRFPARKTQPVLSVMQNVIGNSTNQVVTVHDLRPLFFPDNPLQGFYWGRVLKYSLRKVKAIATVSETSKTRICEHYGIDPNKVFVIHNAFAADGNWAESVPRKKRFLCVGCNWKHKNIHEFLAQHEHWKDEYGVDIVMAETKYKRTLIDFCQKNGLVPVVKFHSDLSDGELQALYRESAALIYPSIDEGFGIPPLEAMANGLPVVASDIQVFRELFEDAPIYVQLGNSQSWKTAMERLKIEEWIKQRVDKGLAISKRYSQARMTEELSGLISAVWPELQQKLATEAIQSRSAK